MTTTEEVRFDFRKVDALRKRMLLTKGQMAYMLGISRVQYHNLLAASAAGGAGMRKATRDRVKTGLERLMTAAHRHSFPTPADAALTGEQRYARLKKLTGFLP
jgi:hypothetical protein